MKREGNNLNTIFRDLSIVWMLLHCCIMFMLLYESRYSVKTTNIITGIFMIPLVILNMACVIWFGTEKAGQFLIFTCVLPSLIFFFIMAKNRDTRFLFTFCFVDTIVLEVLLITNLIDTFSGVENYIVMFASRVILIPMLEFVIVRYLREPYHMLQRRTKKGWGVFSIMSALFYITILLVTYYPSVILERPQYYPYLFLILLLVPVMYVTVFNVLWKQLKLFRTEEENRALSMQIKMANERFANSAESENRLKIMRHDTKHKMILLNDYIKNYRLDEAAKYINDIIDDIDRSALQFYCENNSVNVVLSYYDNISKSNGIELEADINLPKKLKINETDIAVILSNGLENSINYLKSCDKKKIVVKGFLDDGKLYLEIKNPFDGSIVFDGNLPKPDKENHGYGTKSMAAIVKKNNGIYSFVVENGYFIFRCAI